MKKIISLFKRDYESDSRLVYNEVVPGAEWVLNGEGVATIKYDGTSCMIKDGVLYKRYDRKLKKSAYFKMKNDGHVPEISDFKDAPEGWIPAEDAPNKHTGHWPGWIKVDFGLPENKWHEEAMTEDYDVLLPNGDWANNCNLPDGTYELVGPKVQGNPHNLSFHMFLSHGIPFFSVTPPRRSFNDIRDFLYKWGIEGIVYHHPDGRMVKIRRRDFGFEWPIKD